MFFVDGFAEKRFFNVFLCTLLFCVELRLISKSLYFVLFWKHFSVFMGAIVFYVLVVNNLWGGGPPVRQSSTLHTETRKHATRTRSRI